MNDTNDNELPSDGAAGDPDAALDPVARGILDMLAETKPGGTVTPEAIARAIGTARARASDGPHAWRRYMAGVKQQALHLARLGRIQIVRKGKVVDLEDFKGVVRYRLPVAETD